MSLKIMVDSSSGISQEEAKILGIDVFPLRIIFNEEEYYDGINITQEEFYHRLLTENVFPKTSLPNLYDLEKKVKKYTKQGFDVIILPLSREISGSFASITTLFEEFSNVRVVNTLTTINGLRYLALEAKKLENKPIDELVEHLENLQKQIRILAGIDTLEYLHKGGRLSKTVSVLGNFIGLKPIISVVEGKVVLLAKKRGKINAMKYIIEKLENANINYDYPIYGIYSMFEDNYKQLYELIKNLKIKDSLNGCENIAPVIGCHIGPYAYGIVYIEK